MDMKTVNNVLDVNVMSVTDSGNTSISFTVSQVAGNPKKGTAVDPKILGSLRYLYDKGYIKAFGTSIDTTGKNPDPFDNKGIEDIKAIQLRLTATGFDYHLNPNKPS